ncbi:MAG: ATP-binding cassette domain-containing protein, partial [Blautia coccoides]
MRLEAKNLGFRYTNGPWILKNVNFSIEEGERVGLVGPSGYGKSTLVKLLGGYLEPCEGEILLDGKPMEKKGICPVQLIYQHPEKAINPRWK